MQTKKYLQHKKPQSKHFQSVLMMCMVVVMLLTTIMTPVNAYAASKITTTQVTIDDAAWQIVAGVVGEEVTAGKPIKEINRIGSTALDQLLNNNGNPGVGARLLSGLDIANTSEGYPTDTGDSGLVMTYPGKLNKSFTGYKDSKSIDRVRANTVKDILIYDLNTAYALVYDYKKPDSLETYRDNMVELLNAVSNKSSLNGWQFTIGNSSTVPSVSDKTMDPSDYIVLSNGDVSQALAYRIPKGYIDINGRDFSEIDDLKKVSGSEDATYITWGEFAYEAFATYILDEKYGLSYKDVFSGTAGPMESILVDVASSIIDAVTNFLGLWGIDDLILNAGIRGGSAYIGGIFPASWEPIIWTFFYIIEVLSLIVLSFAILVSIYKRAMSTVNPIVRANFMEQIKNILITIFILILMPIIFRLMISTSATLTEIFTSALGEETAKERFSVFSHASGTLGGVIIQFVFMVALIYFNFFYFMRALLVAAMMILGPLCVMAYSFGDGAKNITGDWFKVLVSSIFIQPIHAFIMVLILSLPMEGRGFQSIIAIYALIPITNTIKDVVFKRPADGLHSAATMGQRGTTQRMAAAGNIATGAMIGGAAAGLSSISSFVNHKMENNADGTSDANSNDATQKNGAVAEANAAGTNSANAEKTAATTIGENNQAETSGETTGVNGADGSTQDAEAKAMSFSEKHPNVSAATHAVGRGVSAVSRIGTGIALGTIGGAMGKAGYRTNLQRTANNIASTAFVNPNQKTGANTADPSYVPAQQTEKMMNGVTESTQATGSSADGSSQSEISATPYPLNITANGAKAYYRENGEDAALSDVGMSVNGSRKSPDATISWANNKLNAADQVKLKQFADIMENGTDEEKAALQESGIQDVSVETRPNGNISRYEMTVDKEKFNDNYGINLNGSNGSVTFSDASSIVPTPIVQPAGTKVVESAQAVAMATPHAEKKSMNTEPYTPAQAQETVAANAPSSGGSAPITISEVSPMINEGLETSTDLPPVTGGTPVPVQTTTPTETVIVQAEPTQVPTPPAQKESSPVAYTPVNSTTQTQTQSQPQSQIQPQVQSKVIQQPQQSDHVSQPITVSQPTSVQKVSKPVTNVMAQETKQTPPSQPGINPIQVMPEPKNNP